MFMRLILIVAGVFVALAGHQEYRLVSQASAEPSFVELSELEAGGTLPDAHIRLGHHWKLWDELIYSYRLKEGEREGPGSGVNYAFYPVISEGHPYSQAVDRFTAAGYESADEVPDDAWPVLESFAVLVRTGQFKRVRDIPADATWTEADSLTGLVVNEIRDLEADEQRLLTESFPSLELDQLLIIEEGRRPKSLAWCLGMMALGGGLVGLGLYLMVRSTTGRKAEAGELPPLLKAAEVAR